MQWNLYSIKHKFKRFIVNTKNRVQHQNIVVELNSSCTPKTYDCIHQNAKVCLQCFKGIITNFTYMVPWWDFHASRLLNRRLIVASFKVTMVASGFATRRLATNLKVPIVLPRFVTAWRHQRELGFAISLKATTWFARSLKVISLKVVTIVCWSFSSLVVIYWCFSS